MKAAKGKAGGGRRSKRDAVLDEAAARLNARGVSLASLSEVAQALGLTRAALYYYVEDRDDLVFQCCDAQRALPPIGLRYIDSPRWLCPVCSTVNPVVKIDKPIDRLR